MTRLFIRARCIAAPPPANWRDELGQMLGAKPRRIGAWAELGLYGALRCMAEAGEATLPQDALVMLTSRHGTAAATRLVLQQMQDGLPMPMAFLQTQPSQLLALLAAQLDWRGQACYYAAAPASDLLRLAAAQSGPDGVLLGWVDETEGGSSHWFRLQPGAGAGARPGHVPASSDPLFLPEFSHAA